MKPVSIINTPRRKAEQRRTSLTALRRLINSSGRCRRRGAARDAATHKQVSDKSLSLFYRVSLCVFEREEETEGDASVSTPTERKQKHVLIFINPAPRGVKQGVRAFFKSIFFLSARLLTIRDES